MSEPWPFSFVSAFLYYYLIFTDRRKGKDFLRLVFFGCAAINTRYPSVVIVLIPMIHALFLFIRNFRLNIFLLSILISCFIFFPAFILNVHEPGSVFGRQDFLQWSFGNYFKRAFLTADGFHSYYLPNFCYVFSNLVHPGYIFPGLFFLIFFLRKYPGTMFVKTISLAVLFNALFLAGMPFQNDRVMLLSFPLVLILFSWPYQYLSGKIMKLKPAVKGIFIGSIILVQIAISYRAFMPFYRNNKVIRNISEKVMNYPGKKIYTFNIDMALKGYGITNETVNLWSDKVDFFEPNALVLFNFADSEKQWKGMNPMDNWDRLVRSHHLKLLENFTGGWNLYEITN